MNNEYVCRECGTPVDPESQDTVICGFMLFECMGCWLGAIGKEVMTMPKVKVRITVIWDVPNKPAAYAKAAQLVPDAEYIGVEETEKDKTVLTEVFSQITGK